jgi:hypothetical protein
MGMSRIRQRSVLAGFVAGLAILVTLVPSASASSPNTPASDVHGVNVKVEGSKVVVEGGQVVRAVTYSSGLKVTTIRSASVSPHAWACSLWSYTPTKSGSIVSAHATNSCTGSGYQPMQVCDTVQRLRWWGWQNVSGPRCSGYAYVSSDAVTATYNCAGTGTYNYNGAANGFVEGGAIETPEDDSPSQPRWAC